MSRYILNIFTKNQHIDIFSVGKEICGLLCKHRDIYPVGYMGLSPWDMEKPNILLERNMVIQQISTQNYYNSDIINIITRIKDEESLFDYIRNIRTETYHHPWLFEVVNYDKKFSLSTDINNQVNKYWNINNTTLDKIKTLELYFA